MKRNRSKSTIVRTKFELVATQSETQRIHQVPLPLSADRLGIHEFRGRSVKKANQNTRLATQSQELLKIDGRAASKPIGNSYHS